MDLEIKQKEICQKYNVEFVPVNLDLKIGLSKNFNSNQFPINGIKYAEENGTSRWYIYSGEEIGVEDDFFLPVHPKHLIDICPKVLHYFGLPTGCRFLFDDNYEDVWIDESIRLYLIPQLVKA